MYPDGLVYQTGKNSKLYRIFTDKQPGQLKTELTLHLQGKNDVGLLLPGICTENLSTNACKTLADITRNNGEGVHATQTKRAERHPAERDAVWLMVVNEVIGRIGTVIGGTCLQGIG